MSDIITIVSTLLITSLLICSKPASQSIRTISKSKDIEDITFFSKLFAGQKQPGPSGSPTANKEKSLFSTIAL